MAHFGPFFCQTLQHANHQTKPGGTFTLKPCYCRKFNIFQHWRLFTATNQITSLKCICFVGSFICCPQCPDSLQWATHTHPRSLWDSFMARRLEEAALGTTTHTISNRYRIPMSHQSTHFSSWYLLDPRWTLHQFQSTPIVSCVHRCPGHFTHRHLWLSSKHFGQCVSSWPVSPKAVFQNEGSQKKSMEMMEICVGNHM